ncbi:COMM domain-containing protein 5 [Leptodactylus fuscus]|uniref:COMM domain-containing protein 5 n=1 Tax=Leptodactylus fuscus TaxID=238119 RepID=UPI003F4EAF9B
MTSVRTVHPYPSSSVGSNDRTSYLGARIPPEVEGMARHLKDLDKDVFRKILKAVVGALEGKDSSESVKTIQETTSVSEEQLSFVISGAYTLLRVAFRLSASTLKQEVFREDLKELRIPDDFIEDFANIVYGSRRPVLEDAALKQSIRLPTVEDMRWRVDVAISTSSLSRALQPSILMQMKLSNGESHRFEVPVAKFQELRYNVALLLKEMNDLEKKNILKIQD